MRVPKPGMAFHGEVPFLFSIAQVEALSLSGSLPEKSISQKHRLAVTTSRRSQYGANKARGSAADHCE
jgi:hypothetical protein